MMLYSGKKVAILRGYPRLIDGESTSVEEMYNWGLKNNVEFHTFYYHAIWKKKVPEYKDGYEHEHTKFNKSMIEDIVNEINSNYDLVILINPAKPHSGLTKEDVIEFHKMFKKLTPIKIFMQHTSFAKGMKQTPFITSYINECDAIFNHSADGYFIKDVTKSLPSKVERAFPMHLWLDTKKYKEFYKNEDRQNNLTYIGRFVTYKGPTRLMNISEDIYKIGVKPVIYGMDLSIGCRTHILNHKNCNNLLRFNNENNTNPIVDTYGRINREDVFKKFNESLFACTLFKFKTDSEKLTYGDRLEYTMQEAILSGSILVVDKSWSENCKTIDGIYYKDIPYFAIIMDEEDPQSAIDEIEKVSKDKEIQRKYRETAFNVLVKEYDSSVVLPDLMTFLFSIEPDKDKFVNDFELVKYLTKSEEKAKKFIELYEEGNLLPMVPGTIGENKISIFTGVSGKAIREVE